MMRKRLFALALAALAAAALVSPIAAGATAPVVKGSIDVQVWPAAQPGTTIVIVSSVFPEGTKLPATVQIPVPTSMTVDWAGEITGGDPAADPQREYKIVDGKGGKYVQFEVSQALQAQVEYSGIPITTKGEESSTEVEYVQSVPASITAFSVRMPGSYEAVKLSPAQTGDPESNAQGEKLYTLPSREMKPGDTQVVAVTFRSTPLEPVTTGPSSATVLLVVLGVLIVVAGVVLAVQVRRRPAAVSDGEDAGAFDEGDTAGLDAGTDASASAAEEDDTELRF